MLEAKHKLLQFAMPYKIRPVDATLLHDARLQNQLGHNSLQALCTYMRSLCLREVPRVLVYAAAAFGSPSVIRVSRASPGK